jgi:predicted PurR-regulated permease PerM
LFARFTDVTLKRRKFRMIAMDQPDPGPEPRTYRTAIRAAIAIVAMGLLLLGCVLVLAPFFSAILWGILLSFSTWGIYCELRRMLGERSSLAALVMTLLLATIVVAPFIIVGSSLADNVTDMIQVIRHFVESGPPALPQWLDNIPVIGPHLHDYLTRLAGDQTAQRVELHSLISPLKVFALELGKALGHGIFEISLSLIVCFFLYRDGEMAAARLETAANRIGGERGRELLEVARVTLTGVVHSVLGTALIQGVCGGIGFWIAGVPGAFLLGFATFVLSFLPLGPTLLWLPAAGWLYYQGSSGWAIFLVIWSLVTSTAVEHVLKPIIIARTGGTPFLIVLFGVLGGAITFGFIGVFIGPALLAVGYALIDEWSAQLAA